MPTRPVNMRVVADIEQEIELFRKERIVVFQLESEQRIRLHKGAPPRHDFSASLRDEIERGEFLKNAHRIGGAENGNGAREANVFRARGRSG